MSKRIRHSVAGFTLIEMLLVVSIISLLIAILLPSLNRARSNARTMACQANMRQLSHAAITYSVSNRGKMFPYDNYGGLYYETFWMTLIDAYTGDMDQLRMCPETFITAAGQNGPTGPGWGTVKCGWGMPWTGGWGFLGKNYGSYGWNAWMHSGRTDFIKGAQGDVADDRRHWKNVKQCVTAGKTPFFSDMIWVDTWFHNKIGGPVSNPPADLFAENSGSGRVCIDRHSRGVVHGYVDGSAGWTKLEDLWRLTWNSESTPMDPPWALPAK
jgi:prepilin-type N-terminal cleavage/methylation domain-containing protein